MRTRLVFFLIFVFTTSMVLMGGCRQEPAKKPVPRTNVVTPRNTVTTPAKKPVAPLNISESRKLADKLSNRAVKVKGVRSATVVVQPANNQVSVMVGLVVNSNVTGKETVKVKEEVSRQLRMADKRVTRVLVTTDPDLVKRIEDIARGIIAGKPVQSFASEISELTRRIAPTMK